MVRNPYEDGSPEYCISYSNQLEQFKRQFKYAVESWVLLARYFIYAAYLDERKGLTVN
jgi:hypothetical protein